MLGEHSCTAIDECFAGKEGIRAGLAKSLESAAYRLGFRRVTASIRRCHCVRKVDTAV